MKPLFIRLFLVAQLLAPLGAQELPPPRPHDSPHWMHYKRFTRGGDAVQMDDAEGRRQWWRERLGGDLPPGFMQRVLREAERMRAEHPQAFRRIEGSHAFSGILGGTWTSLGPTNADFSQNGVLLNVVDSGRIRTILPHPTDANTVYLLTTGGGLWKSNSFLSPTPSWTPLSDQVGSTMGGSACFGRDPQTLYLGMGEPFETLGVGGFVIRSSDGGASWSPAVFMTGATRVYDLKVDTSVGTNAATDIVLAATDDGIFRSANGGSSFSKVGPLSSRACSLVRTSAGWVANTTTTTSDRAGSLYFSTDNGATWAPIPNAGNVITNIGRTTLAVGQPGDSVVYAFAAKSGDGAQRDLFRSQDGGLNWTALGLDSKVPINANANQPFMDIMQGQAFFNQMLLVDPTDSARNTVYIGGQLSSAKSSNGGNNWTIISNWLPGAASGTFELPYVHADFHSAAFSSAGGTNRLFFGTDGGLFTSVDGGLTWDDTRNKGLACHLIYALAVSPSIDGSALIGLQDNGTRIRKLSPAPGGTYNQIRGGDGFGVGWSQANQATVLLSYVYNDIRRSTTNPPAQQADFSAFMEGLPTPVGNVLGSSNSYYFVTPIIAPSAAADPSGKAFFTYGTGGSGAGAQQIYKSGASGWNTIGRAGVAGLDSGRFVRAVSHGIGVHPTDLNRIAAAGNGGYILITTNGGNAWTERYLGTAGDGQNIGWLGYNANIAWASNDVLYACSEAVEAGATRVARTANGGATWVKADMGLPDVPVTKLAVDPADPSGNTVYAATWLGVYATTTGGGSWTPLGSGFPQVPTSDLYLAPDSSYLRASTYGRGVWELAIGPSISFQPQPQTVIVGQTATFAVTASGNGPLDYQWKKNGASVGTNAPSFTTPPTVLGDNGALFAVAITDSTGTRVSASVLLTVNPPPTGPTINTQPQNQTVTAGQMATFTVAATAANGTLGYQWKRNGTNVGSNAAAYTTPPAALSENGAVFSVTVTDAIGPTTSTNAVLTVSPKSRDLTGDGTVDVLDLAILARAYGSTPSSSNWNLAADLNGDGVIDENDLTLFLAGF